MSASRPARYGIALAAAGLIAAAPMPAPLPELHVSRIIALLADGDITIDFVRHGESTDNVAGILGTRPPGAPLTDLGRDQSIAIGNLLHNGDPSTGVTITNADDVYASEFLRAQQTAWPLLQILAGNTPTAAQIPDGPMTPISGIDPSQILPGLNELDGGILQGLQLGAPGAILYMLPPLAWTLGLYFVPQWGSTIDPNGMAFQDSFGQAVQTIYDNSADGATSAAFSHAASIMAWTQMNVENPNLLLIPLSQLNNAGQVVITGNPTDGWLLESWNGIAMPDQANLIQDLFVSTRDLITIPQMAAWHLWEALLTFNGGNISDALQTGVSDIFQTTLNYPGAIIDAVIGAIQGDIPLGLSLSDWIADPAELLSGTDLAALLPGELGVLATDVLSLL